MGKSKALSHRQQRQARKAVAKPARVVAAPVMAVARMAEPAEPRGMAARVAQQDRLTSLQMTQVGLDLAVAVALGNITPGFAAEEFGVETRLTNHLVVDSRGKVKAVSALSVKGRDGLLALHQTGSLTDVETKAGLAYRLCYETAAKSLGSALGNAGEGRVARDWTTLKVGVDEEGELFLAASALELHRAYVMVRLNQMERAVNAVIVDGRELHALRLIAGEGQTVREVAGQGGHAKAAYRRALARALSAVAEALRITAH